MFNERATDRLVGDCRVQQIYHTLDSFYRQTRSSEQKSIHDHMIRAYLPHIFGVRDFEEHKTRILDEYKVEHKDQMYMLALIGHNRGFSTAAAMFCAAVLTAVPDVHIRILTNGGHSGKQLITMIEQQFDLLVANPDHEDPLFNENTQYTKSVRHDGDQSSSVTTSLMRERGVDASLIILEDAQYIASGNHLIPLIGVTHTAIFALINPFRSHLEDDRKWDTLPICKLFTPEYSHRMVFGEYDPTESDEKTTESCLPKWKPRSRKDYTQTTMNNNKDNKK